MYVIHQNVLISLTLDFLCSLENLFTWEELEKEIEHLYSEVEKLNMPICLSHNDLWHTNILYDEETGQTFYTSLAI